MSLNDDTLLDKIKLSDPKDEAMFEQSKHLSQLEQVILNCTLFDHKKNNPHYELTFEEMSPYIEVILIFNFDCSLNCNQ